MICPYWCFKDTGYKFKSYVCNKCRDMSMMACKLENY